MITSVASPVHLTPTSSSWAASQHTTPTSSALSHVSPSQNPLPEYIPPPLNLTPVAQPNDERLPPRRGDDPFPHAAIRCVPPCRIPFHVCHQMTTTRGKIRRRDAQTVVFLFSTPVILTASSTGPKSVSSLLHPSHIHNDPSRC
jgi:hypothetical protein